jgi:hypothetical protein
VPHIAKSAHWQNAWLSARDQPAGDGFRGLAAVKREAGDVGLAF